MLGPGVRTIPRDTKAKPSIDDIDGIRSWRPRFTEWVSDEHHFFKAIIQGGKLPRGQSYQCVRGSYASIARRKAHRAACAAVGKLGLQLADLPSAFLRLHSDSRRHK